MTTSAVFDAYAKIMSEKGLVKTAKETAYDVSKETGEDLVDSAHPGKMHTEVKCEGDGALVETIVEQQAKDIEIVNKMPKGTYAALSILCDCLVARGHADKIGELVGVLEKFATPNDRIEHSLITLATKLDAQGFSKAADMVDGLLKKNADEQSEWAQMEYDKLNEQLAQKYLAAVLSKLSVNEAPYANLQKASKQIKDFKQARTIAEKITGGDKEALYAGMSAVTQSEMKKLNDLWSSVIGKSESRVGVADKTKFSETQKLIAFQKWFNKVSGGKKPLNTVGKMDEETKRMLNWTKSIVSKLKSWDRAGEYIKKMLAGGETIGKMNQRPVSTDEKGIANLTTKQSRVYSPQDRADILTEKILENPTAKSIVDKMGGQSVLWKGLQNYMASKPMIKDFQLMDNEQGNRILQTWANQFSNDQFLTKLMGYGK